MGRTTVDLQEQSQPLDAAGSTPGHLPHTSPTAAIHVRFALRLAACRPTRRCIVDGQN